MVDSYEIDFMKGNVTLLKVDEIYNIIIIVYLSRDEDGIGWSRFLL